MSLTGWFALIIESFFSPSMIISSGFPLPCMVKSLLISILDSLYVPGFKFIVSSETALSIEFWICVELSIVASPAETADSENNTTNINKIINFLIISSPLSISILICF